MTLVKKFEKVLIDNEVIEKQEAIHKDIEELKSTFRNKIYRNNSVKVMPYKMQLESFMSFYRYGKKEFSEMGKQITLLKALCFFDTEDIHKEPIHNMFGEVDFSEPYPVIGNSKTESIKFYKNGKVQINFYEENYPKEFYELFEMNKL